jgi:5,10-methylenetetrahydrofolate reductase
MKAIGAGKFVFTGEIQPKKTANFDDVIKAAKILKGHVVACNVTDNPRAHGYLSSLAVAHIIQEEAGMEAICQITVRDRNRIALLSELLGAAALGIRNILTMSGDHTSLSDNPASMPVYDLDTAQFVHMVRKMVDEGVDLNGNKIHGKVKLHIGIVGNPNADPLEVELLKIQRKVRLGADFMQTQAVYNIEKAKGFLDEMRHCPIPVLLGIFPCRSSVMAKFLAKNVPGVSIPKDFIEELKKAEETDNNLQKENRIVAVNVRYFTDYIREIKRTTHTAGIHVMALGYESIVKSLIESISE